eukprot:UN03453
MKNINQATTAKSLFINGESYTMSPTPAPTLCWIAGPSTELDVGTLNDWTSDTANPSVGPETIVDGETITISDDPARCYATNPCIRIVGIGDWQDASDIWIEQTLDTSIWTEVKLNTEASTYSLDLGGGNPDFGFIETQCDAANATRSTFHVGAGAVNTHYSGCATIDTTACNSLTIRVGGYLSGTGDHVFLTQLSYTYTGEPTMYM